MKSFNKRQLSINHVFYFKRRFGCVSSVHFQDLMMKKLLQVLHK